MTGTAFTALRRYVPQREERPLNDRTAHREEAEEHCELCSVAIAPRHRHLFEIGTRQLVCACDACALRFEGLIGGRYKLVPRDPVPLPNFQIADHEWAALGLPIALAFFFQCTSAGKTLALYPSPGGATESLLPLSSWETVVSNNPPLQQMQSDVEALLVNRMRDARAYFIAPIDLCYELVGTIRLHWHGFSGGDEVWAAIDDFFARLT